MLESMIENPLPTRAEVTDVANAVFEQADAIMLSGETATGKYPVKCIEVFDTVARRIERTGGANYADAAQIVNHRHKLVNSAIVLADSFEHATIVVFTRGGEMADHVSHLRPKSAAIYAFAPSTNVVRKLSLNWATEAIQMDFEDRPEATVAKAEKILLERGLVESGYRLVVISDILAGEDRYDSIHIRDVH